MPRRPMLRAASLLATTLLVLTAGAQTKPKDSELDALELTAEAPKPKADTPAAPKGTRLAIEAAIGRLNFDAGLGHEQTRRVSLDLRFSKKLDARWRGVFSDRIDHFDPSSGSGTINTLREAYLGWQSESAATSVEFGRVNLRTGPGYGFNPSDFFRDGSLRTSTTLDPVALRDYRQGSVALRVQRLWSGGGVSAVVSPRITERRSSSGASLDFGSTNHSTRLQLGWSADPAPGVSTQLLAFKQSGEPARLGGNVTALLGGATVFHVEGAYGSERDLFDRVFSTPAAKERSQVRASTGLTHSFPGGVSLTAEYQYNDFALSKSTWDRVAATAGPAVLAAYLQEADRLQDLPVRRAALIYLSKKDLMTRGLSLTAFARVNVTDKSRLVWAELRKEFGAIDVGLQWQQLNGKPTSEFGVLPLRRSMQIVATFRI